MSGQVKSRNIVIAVAVVVLLMIALAVFVIATIIHDKRVREEMDGWKGEPSHYEPNPKRIVKTPHSPDYDEGYKCNTDVVEYKGYAVTFWTLGSRYSPGNPIDGFLRIEAIAPRAEKEVDEFHPGDVHVAALRFADRVKVREDDQQPHFYHVGRDRLGLEAHLVDLVSTNATRVGMDRANWLPEGQYLLELTVQMGAHDSVQIKDIYIEVVERHGPIFDEKRLRKARLPEIRIPPVRGGPIDEPKKPNLEGV